MKSAFYLLVVAVLAAITTVSAKLDSRMQDELNDLVRKFHPKQVSVYI